MSTIRRFRQGMVAVGTAAFLLSGCSQVIKVGANVALGFTQNHIVPPMMAFDDPAMMCAGGDSLTPVIMTTKSMGADPAKVATLLYLVSGICAENKATEADLRYLRASRANQLDEAKDARLEEKRWAEIAARREYAGYQLFAEHWEHQYRVKMGEQCPAMKNDQDKLIFLVGYVSGVNAVVNDIASGGNVNVPKDIAAFANRGMACLDSTKFWGAPNALRAAIWTLLPGAGDGNPDPWQVLKDSSAQGEKSGVRLSQAIYAVAAQASGDKAKLREAIRTYGQSIGDDKPVNADYKLVDGLARMMVRNISDKYWTENTGQRTPEDGYTHFWDEAAADPTGLKLDNLLDDAAAPAAGDASAAAPAADAKAAKAGKKAK